MSVSEEACLSGRVELLDPALEIRDRLGEVGHGLRGGCARVLHEADTHKESHAADKHGDADAAPLVWALEPEEQMPSLIPLGASRRKV